MTDEDYHSLLTDEETEAQKVEYNNLPLGLELTVVELVCKLRALEWPSLYISLSLDVRKKTGTQCRSQHWGHTAVYQHAPIPKTQKHRNIIFFSSEENSSFPKLILGCRETPGLIALEPMCS